MQSSDFKTAYELLQKAYFFYPDYQVETLLYSALLVMLEKSTYDDIADIDYLAHFARFKISDMNSIVGIFNNLLYQKLQFTDKEELCNQLYERLISQITDENLKEELSFTFHLQMSYRYQNTAKIGNYIEKAFMIKGNHHDAKIMMENHLQTKLSAIHDPHILLDSLKQLENRLNSDAFNTMFYELRLVSFLQLALKSFDNKNSVEGNEYLDKFEEACILPVTNQWVGSIVESTYWNAASYYFRRGYYAKANEYKQRGLKFVPASTMLGGKGY